MQTDHESTPLIGSHSDPTRLGRSPKEIATRSRAQDEPDKAVGSQSDPTRAMLIDAKAVGTMLGVTEATVRRRDREEEIPRPVVIDGQLRWHRQDIRRWINQGLPPRAAWEASPQSTWVPPITKADQD